MRYILTVNTGSSSLKAAIYQEGKKAAAYQILLSGIGADDGMFSVKEGEGHWRVKEQKRIAAHKDALMILLQWLRANHLEGNIQAAGHRLVHGGAQYRDPVLITPEVLKNLQKIIPYDPLHLPPELEGIACIQEVLPTIPQVACFDTAFHSTLPEVAKVLAIPYAYTEEGIFRYGFHGLSYESVVDVLKERKVFPERLIIAHLGSGCSMAAVKEGKSIDTTMGFTSTGGLVMGTRTGDLDPGVIAYLLSEKGMDAKELGRMINFESGLKGISERTSEMVELLNMQDKKAKLAVEIFCYQIKKMVGAYAAVLGGLDMLVFTGGIGEHAQAIRDKICQNLEFLGIGRRVEVDVVNANEEMMIAQHTLGVLRLKAIHQDNS